MNMEQIKYQCEECNRRFSIDEDPHDRLDEPICPECGQTNCIEIGE